LSDQAVRHSRQDATPFYRMGRTTVLPELLMKDMRGFREGGPNVPIGNAVARGEIGVQLAANRGRPRCKRGAAVGIAGRTS